MIHTKLQIGRHTPMVVEFGTGDILIQNAFDLKRKTEYVYFIQAEEGPIGEEREGWKFSGQSSDVLPDIPVALLFTKTESIDVLIDCLQKAKEELTQILNKPDHE
jgi:hypothetical protein